MDPAKPDIMISDVVISTTGRDRNGIYYVVGVEEPYLMLANGKDRTLEQPKRKKRKHIAMVLRSETRVANKLRRGDKVLNSELRRDLAIFSRDMQSNGLGGL